jgi:hypothetical protein
VAPLTVGFAERARKTSLRALQIYLLLTRFNHGTEEWLARAVKVTIRRLASSNDFKFPLLVNGCHHLGGIP